MRSPSITESPNELTRDIDVASPEGIARLLRGCDAQIYNGYRAYPGLGDAEIVWRVAKVVEWASAMIGRQDTAIIISGAGTSGRLAMFCSQTFNRYLRRRHHHPNFHYLIAGGNQALIKAQEGAEDDPIQAWEDLRSRVRGKRQVLFIGITCALAAPYVASQLWHLSRRRTARCALIGFNPQEAARDLEIENWDRTFADVVEHLSSRSNALIINPVVGPEPVTGSTRMKGGSATKLLLETIFSLAARNAFAQGDRLGGSALHTAVLEIFRCHEQARLAAYHATDRIASLIEMGARALRHGAHIYYIGTGTPGILGLIDASECPPTFGADFEDVRGFIDGGWKTLLGRETDLESAGPWYRIGLGEFLEHRLSRLDKHDLVVALPSTGREKRLFDALQRSRRAGAATAIVQATGRPGRAPTADLVLRIDDLPRSILPGADVFGEYATKLILNALTTGAHIMSGKVFENRMVDLRISNTKLYHRALGIIQHITGVTAEDARRALIRSIHCVNRATPRLLSARTSQHVQAATNGARIVPRALIMAGARVSYDEADRMLTAEPVIRNAIERLKRSSRP